MNNTKEGVPVFVWLKRNPVVVILIILLLAFGIFAPGFATVNNMLNLLRQCSIIGVAAIGVSICMIAGGFDLSVGATMSITTVVVALLLKAGMPNVVACLGGLLTGCLIGTINATAISVTNMNAFIFTLAMQQAIKGVAFMITGGIPIYGLPAGIKTLGQGYLGIIPIPVIIMLVCYALATFVMSKTYIGRHFYATGSNIEAARLSGLQVKKTRFYGYIICGLFASLAGLIVLGRTGAGQANAAEGMEMDIITACIVGGVSMAGGVGRIPMILLGVIVMGTITNGLGVMGVSTYGQLVCKGVILAVVVGIDSIRSMERN